MLKSSSTNRQTRLKVFEDGNLVKTIPTASINYGVDFEQLKKMIEIAIRLSPQDPVYHVEKLFITAGADQEFEIDPKELELIKNSLFKHDAPTPVGAKITLLVHVKKQVPVRSVSRGAVSVRERVVAEKPQEPSKYDNILRATTPAKMRSVSRGRTTTPGKLRGNPSPARPSRCSSASTDSDNSSRVANRLREGFNETIRRVTSRDSTGSVKSETSATQDMPTENSVPIPPAPAAAPVAPVQQNAVVQPPAPLVPEEQQPVTETKTAEPTIEKRTPLKMRRLSVLDVTEESRKNIDVCINQTWKEVDELPEIKTPPNSHYLGAFNYHSPVPLGDIVSPMNQDDDYVSCAGDLGMEAHQEESVNLEDSMQQMTIEDKEQQPADVSALETVAEEASEVPESQENCDSQSISENVSEPNDNSNKNVQHQYSSPQKKSSSMHTPNSAAKSARKSTVPVSSAHKQPQNKANSRLSQTAIRPVYPDGKTLGELSVSYDNSLRSSNMHPHGHKMPQTEMKRPKPTNDFSPPAKGHRRTSSFKETTHKDGEGRPSIGTITSQWEFMRTNFVNNSDEELEWLMISKRGGAYNYAHKKVEMAEDKYFKSLYEIELYENKLQTYFIGFSAKFPNLLQELASHYSSLMATPKDETLGNLVVTVYTKLVNYVEENKQNDLFSIFSTKFNNQLTSLLTEGTTVSSNTATNNAPTTNSSDKFKIVRKARDLHQTYQPEIFSLQSKLQQIKKDSEEALKNMEKWTKREVETDEYPSVMKRQEEEFMEKERVENEFALRTMRSYFPDPNQTTNNKSINELTVPEVQQEYVALHGLISFELVQELKNNKLLQWIITHPDDIAYSNFLNGEKKTYFENIESLDIIEMRALAMVLPGKFENDNDNKKLEWRNRFMSRLKNVIAQYNQEKVKGCWDGANNCRTMVTLPALKPDQLRRPVYYYRTKEQSDVKLKQYNDKLALLEKKKNQLEVVEKETKEAKEEFHTLLQEMRDPDIVNMVGPEKIAMAKEQAKNEWNSCEKKRKTLAQDVQRLQKSIDDNPMSRDQFIEKEKELCEFLKARGVEWDQKGQAPVIIDGVFSTDRVIEKQVKAAAKFLSAEEEAEQRKMELLSFKSRSTVINSETQDETESNTATAVQPNENLNASFSMDDFMISADTALNSLTNSSVNPVAAPVPEPTTTSMAAVTMMSPVRKNSVLLIHNPDFINNLTKVIGGGAINPEKEGSTPLRSRSVGRRSTLGMTFGRTPSTSSSSSTTENNNESAEGSTKEVKNKTTKSKLLQQLLNPFGSSTSEKSAENANPNNAPPRAQLSFLDQIKLRAGGKKAPTESVEPSENGNASAGNSSTVEEAPVMMKPKNPLFGGGGPLDGGGGMSFLEQIKSRRKVEE